MTDRDIERAPSQPRRRLYRSDDAQALYQVCLQTGDAGKDASALFQDPTLLGDLYVGPYLHFPDAVAWTIEDEEGVCGYLLAVPDTQAYQAWHLKHWLPAIRKDRRPPQGDPASYRPDDTLLAQIFDFEFDSPEWLDSFPAHMHIDLLPHLQGRGLGTHWTLELFDCLKDLGCPGLHLGMHPENKRALAFYTKLGFGVLEQVELPWEEVLYLGKNLMD